MSGFLSDQAWQSASNGYGPVERDRSNGEGAAGDGNALTLSGRRYARGLGVHADSSVVFVTAGRCSTLSASIGIDDESRAQTGRGSVVFRVYGDSAKLYDSGVMTGSTATRAIKVDLRGHETLRLVVDQHRNVAEGDRSPWFDHADWAEAKVTCDAAGAPASPAVSAPLKLQAEDFDRGGEGVGYHDNDAANQGGQYRTTEGVDIDRRGNPEGYGVGWSGAGEWLNYTVNVDSAGTYGLNFRLATLRTGELLEISVDGVKVLTPSLPDTGGFDTPQVVRAGDLRLSAGKQVVRVAYVGSAPAVNLDWLELAPSDAPAPAPTPTPTPTPTPEPAVSTTFTGTSEDFPNPERGFHGDSSDLAAEPTGSLSGQADLGFRLVRTYIRLDDFRNSALSADWLSKLDQGFGRARAAGLKVVLRFSYNFPGSDYANAPDANVSLVLQHIQQIKPILARNADVIAFWQAGFVGAWGEWHDSVNGLDSDANKVTIRDALLDALPEGRFLQMRYPDDMRRWYPSPPTEADTFTTRARIGIYNDCFLANNGDAGTYGGLNDPLREYTKALSRVTPFGAETCDVGGNEARMDCPDILREGREYALTYLNFYFWKNFIDGWKARGCYDEVSRSIGYRFRLTAATHPASAARGSVLPLQVTVSNDGWSRLFNPRTVRVVLRHTTTGQLVDTAVSGVDPRRWLPGSSTTVALPVAIPAQATPGTYDVLLGLPDAATTLASDARYAIRPANADDPSRNQAWETGSGLFRLGTRVTLN
ncbi:DUF4832 domain-containing protein [Deinococcus koreensis]|uniref:DUF4832 domain-containing protein n=1 Tax=Deinococcus koreensis TaxID=2054903 RepID=UPI0013FD53E3|nr:DUF4832 domain-containing protein [Deinococcus koreensis]